MKLSISNIAWNKEDDDTVYKLIKKYGYDGLEIAPTRIVGENPYEKIQAAGEWYARIKKEYGLSISSMQSIWYGRTENIFAGEKQRNILIEYTKKAVLFAQKIDCHNLVLGCPKNRNIGDGMKADGASDFFYEIAEYAAAHDTVISIEANPEIYNTNYVNNTIDAIMLVKEVNSQGFRINLDIGTIIANEEDIDVVEKAAPYINHLHISEPWLKPVIERNLHGLVLDILKKNDYKGYISIEMGKGCGMECIENTIKYVKKLQNKYI